MIKVYAGLSAQRPDVLSILPDAICASPIQRGDILSDIEDGVNSILILDGLFHQALSVCPSEIMDALRRGIQVYGASSMGALRAAELEVYGMIGIGDIFEHIRDAPAFRDDFLGQVFIDGFPQIQEASVTYVEFDINLKSLLRRRRISLTIYDYLSALYADLHYAERNLTTLESRIRSEKGSPEQFLGAARSALATMSRPKKRDAQKALRLVGDHNHRASKISSMLKHPLDPAAMQQTVKRNSFSAKDRRLPELGAAYSARDLISALSHSETVTYRDNGNRVAQPREVLKELDRLMSLVGATRLAEISQLATHGLPVYQSTRPAPFGHTGGGTTTGAQGKGPTPEQARISCLAETVEGYCLEPRNEQMIRASYGFLRKHRAVADPRQFQRAIGVQAAKVNEPLMWTDALCLEQQETVLVPAELVFFDFFATDYATRSIFPCSTQGAGAGATHLEAVTHALYECIEGHYEAAIEYGIAKPRRLRHKLEGNSAGSEVDIQLYTALLPGIENLPFVYCVAESTNLRFVGSGCFSSPETAISRAISEAIQTISTTFSGSREDLEDEDEGPDWHTDNRAPRRISYSEYRSRVVSRKFNDLRSEYRFLLRWLHAAGFPVTYVANLTRRGIEFPVVKAIIPGMLAETGLRNSTGYSTKDVQRDAYGID